MAADGPREKLLSCENLNGDQQEQQHRQLSLAEPRLGAMAGKMERKTETPLKIYS